MKRKCLKFGVPTTFLYIFFKFSFIFERETDHTWGNSREKKEKDSEAASRF